MIVVGTNVLAYLYLGTEFSGAAEDLLRRVPDWAAPLRWRSEFRSILTGYMRREALTFDQAQALQAEPESLLAGGEHELDSTAVLMLVRDSDCSAYGREFAALAMRLGVKLLTMNRQLLEAFPKHAVALVAPHR